MSNYAVVLIIVVLVLGSIVGSLIWIARVEDRRANLPNPIEVRLLTTLVNEAEVIFRFMTDPVDLEAFDILTEDSKQRIEVWRKTHRKLP